MNAIQCFSSYPVLCGRQVCGLYEEKKEIFLPEYILLGMKLSALQWRRTNGAIKLYTDSPMKKYLESQGILNCWDLVDTELLDSFYEECRHINFGTFWSAGKFACYMQEKAPFVCIDTDLIVWEKLEFDKTLDFAFAHWEKIEEGDESYPELSRIHRPDDYTEWDESIFEDRICQEYACNMSITYLGSEKLRKDFAARALRFMSENEVEADGRYAVPEILYAEQRLPLALTVKNNMSYAPILPCVWSPKRFCILSQDSRYKNWFFADLDVDRPFTHMWFHKKYLAENKAARAEYCSNLRKYIDIQEEKQQHTRICKIEPLDQITLHHWFS